MYSLRVARGEISRYRTLAYQGRPLGELHTELTRILRERLSPAAASLLALPLVTPDAAFVEWYSDLAGQPVPVSQLGGDERKRAVMLLEERLQALRSLAGRLESEGQAWLAGALHHASGMPPLADVFLVSGQPVITGWAGHSIPIAAAAVPVAAAVGGRAGTGWLWLIPALLLFLLLGVATWWWWPEVRARWGQEQVAVVPPPAPVVPAPTVVEPPAVSPSDEAKRLQEEINALEAELRRKLSTCEAAPLEQPLIVPEPHPQQPPPVPEDPVPEAPVPEAPVVEAPVVPPLLPAPPPPVVKKTPTEKPPVVRGTTPPPPPVPPAEKEKKPSEVPPKEARSPKCPSKPMAKWEAPELVVLLDSSGSMRESSGSRGSSRIEAAKDAVRGVVHELPPEIDVGLVVFGQCRGADNHKFFTAGERDRLNALLATIQPQQGTPLARGLERAGNAVDGVNVPATIIIVSDGEDTCGGDPCAVARALKARKPLLKINFIDVGGTGAGQCLAKVTGGRVFTAKDGSNWRSMLQAASEQPAGCR